MKLKFNPIEIQNDLKVCTLVAQLPFIIAMMGIDHEINMDHKYLITKIIYDNTSTDNKSKGFKEEYETETQTT